MEQWNNGTRKMEQWNNETKTMEQWNNGILNLNNVTM